MANRYDITEYDDFNHDISLSPLAGRATFDRSDSHVDALGQAYLSHAPSKPLLDHPRPKEDVAIEERSIRASQASIISQRIRKQHLFADWKWELAASILSYAAILALVAILYTYNHTNKVHFGSTSLSLNSVVAVLATTIRVCCMFPVGSALLQGGYIHARRAARRAWSGQRLSDLEVFHDASRGAIGSLKLFVTIKPQLATLGALLTILALGFDFFSQQILGLETKVVYDRQIEGIPSILSLDNITGLPWTGALYSGIFATSVPDLIVPCPTGYCDWPVTPTIGVCSACQDITSSLQTTCNAYFEEIEYCTSATPLGQHKYCDFNGDGNVTLTAPLADTPAHVVYESWNSVGSMGCGSGTAFQNRSNTTWPIQPIALFDSVNVLWEPANDNANASSDGGWIFSKPFAQECGMWLCVQALNVSTYNGTQTETLLDTWSERVVLYGNQAFTKPPDSFPVNATFFDSFIANYTSYLPSIAVYGSYDTVQINDGTASTLSGSGKLLPLNNSQGWSSSSSVLQAAKQYILDDAHDLTPWVTQIAKALTNELRSNSNNLPSLTNDYFAGSMQKSEAVFAIRWPWIVLPALMVILSSLFLAISIQQTARARMPAWKGSPLNLIFAKVDTELDQLVKGSLSRADAVVDEAGKTGVELYPDEAGRWVFGMKRCSRL